MKVGIVTLYNAYNYGAFFQAYALYTFLKQLGHEVCFIKHNLRRPLRRIVLLSMRALLLGKWKKSRLLINIAIGILKALSNFDFCSIGDANNLDVVLFGSDEIWNIANPRNLKAEILFGKGIAVKKVAYAPSVNAATFEDFFNAPHIIEYLKCFDEISVRDNKSYVIMSRLLERPVQRVVDPTLLLKKNVYKSVERNCEIQGKYLLLYSYGNYITPDEIASIQLYAKKSSMKIVSILYYFDWCDVNYGLDPFKAMNAIANAECIVTDTFHGIMMSIVYQKEFVILNAVSDKIADVVDTYGLHDRLYNCENTIESILSRKVEFDRISIILDKNVKSSQDYIENQLKKILAS